MEKLTVSKWDELLTKAAAAYQPIIDEIEDNEKAYEGTRAIKKADGVTDANKNASNVRKMCFELIESQIDSVIPMPKVTSPSGFESRAMLIESMIRNELDRLDIEEINDEQGRTTPIAGASIFFVEWDVSRVVKNRLGALKIRNLDPKQVIPQDGVYKQEDMDYIFLQFEQTEDYILDTYGVDVSMERDESVVDDEPRDHMRTHNFAFYRNEDGYIGLISWVGGIEVQNFNNYYARQKYVCKECGAIALPGTKECEVCGSKKGFEYKQDKNEKISFEDPKTKKMIDIDVPYYIPRCFPIVIRKNVSRLNRFLGGSDVTAIKDQQNDLNIFMSKIREKTLKGGSIVTLPSGVKFKLTDDELKIVRVSSIKDLSLISVKELKGNIRDDLTLLETNYEIGRQTLGITDSFQGRADSTATSGKAKQFAAAQSAGRLDSKKKMKNFAFSNLFKLMFYFMLAYADEPRPIIEKGTDGKNKYDYFDKKIFIEKDEAGNYYYDDDFLFAEDVSGTLANDRQAMWQETRSNFEGGAYGDPLQIDTLIMYWNMMDSLHYPGAKQVLSELSARLEKQQKMQKEQMALKAAADSKIEKVAKENANLKDQQKGNRKKTILEETMNSIGG